MSSTATLRECSSFGWVVGEVVWFLIFPPPILLSLGMIEAWILEGMMAFRKSFGFALMCLGFLELGWSFGVLDLSLPFGSASAGLLKESYLGV